ncbi:hypothetical protein EDF62_3265 [Leucobacter luti]|uniref:Uncharacterized protein n=1 Tax=Leucobacter luti TaxID=340320 RepID=A0A4R6RS37_9MICO|nr:hypothetical protein [Leucobacter luti]TDP89534.1 hypothetical protein EDF62_3265 [Leucobacter luti]
MSGWNDQFSRSEELEEIEESSTEASSHLPGYDDPEEADTSVEPVESEPDPKKPKSAIRKRSSGAITRAQVQRVLDLRADLETADTDLVSLLAHVAKSEKTADDLTIALITQTATDDVLGELAILIEAADENPFRLSAQLTGMDRPSRNRIHALLTELSGSSTPLPRDEINAAVELAGLISGLSADQRSLISRAQDIRG